MLEPDLDTPFRLLDLTFMIFYHNFVIVFVLNHLGYTRSYVELTLNSFFYILNKRVCDSNKAAHEKADAPAWVLRAGTHTFIIIIFGYFAPVAFSNYLDFYSRDWVLIFL